jgi:hypothetical protein
MPRNKLMEMASAWLTISLMAIGLLACRSPRPLTLAQLDLLRPVASARQASDDSVFFQGNGDFRVLAPGATLTMADLHGPGMIQHIWCTTNATDLEALVLRIYWDDAAEPAVESPYTDFFGLGFGQRVPLNSMPVQVSGQDAKACNCFWKMPFHKRARVTVTNESTTATVGNFYYYVDYAKLAGFPRGTPYFHAQYRQAHPCPPGPYVVCETQGAGYYVGTVLAVRNRNQGWFGEGDDRFYLDGATTPTLQGTGTEDYFASAYGFSANSGLYSGAPLADWNQHGSIISVYRWHIADPIYFNTTLHFDFEHTGPLYGEGRLLQGYAERADDFSSVAFWYQTARTHPRPEWPPLEARKLKPID